MLAVIGFVLGLVVVSGVLFVIGAVVFGRGEELAPPPRDSTPVVLPADRIPDAEDVEALRLSVVLRGYRMHEVDWVLDQLGEALREKDAQIAALTNQLTQQPGGQALVSAASTEDDDKDEPSEPVPITSDEVSIAARNELGPRERSEHRARNERGAERSDARSALGGMEEAERIRAQRARRLEVEPRDARG